MWQSICPFDQDFHRLFPFLPGVGLIYSVAGKKSMKKMYKLKTGLFRCPSLLFHASVQRLFMFPNIIIFFLPLKKKNVFLSKASLILSLKACLIPCESDTQFASF